LETGRLGDLETREPFYVYMFMAFSFWMLVKVDGDNSRLVTG